MSNLENNQDRAMEESSPVASELELVPIYQGPEVHIKIFKEEEIKERITLNGVYIQEFFKNNHGALFELFKVSSEALSSSAQRYLDSYDRARAFQETRLDKHRRRGEENLGIGLIIQSKIKEIEQQQSALSRLLANTIEGIDANNGVLPLPSARLEELINGDPAILSGPTLEWASDFFWLSLTETDEWPQHNTAKKLFGLDSKLADINLVSIVPGFFSQNVRNGLSEEGFEKQMKELMLRTSDYEADKKLLARISKGSQQYFEAVATYKENTKESNAEHISENPLSMLHKRLEVDRICTKLVEEISETHTGIWAASYYDPERNLRTAGIYFDQREAVEALIQDAIWLRKGESAVLSGIVNGDTVEFDTTNLPFSEAGVSRYDLTTPEGRTAAVKLLRFNLSKTIY
jgi:hypothetical protein